MGNVMTTQDAGDPNYSFHAIVENTGDYPCQYPNNEQFGLRIKQQEWTKFMLEYGQMMKKYRLVFVVLIVFAFAGFIIGIALTPYAFIFWFLITIIAMVIIFFQMTMSSKLVDRYNIALFHPRGITAKYYQGGKRRASKFHFTMKYPANGSSFGGRKSLDRNLEEYFRAANEEFSRSPVASAPAPLADAANVNNTGATLVPNNATGTILVQVPPGAVAGSIIQAFHNGQPLHVTVPPGTQPGAVISVAVPSVPHAYQQQALPPQQHHPYPQGNQQFNAGSSYPTNPNFEMYSGTSSSNPPPY